MYVGYANVTPEAVEELRRLTTGWLRPTPYTFLSEWAYAEARAVLLVEEFIGSGEIPFDYKFYVFDGQPAGIQVHAHRFADHKVAFYTIDWELLPTWLPYYPMAGELPRPPQLAKMVQAAAELGRDFDFMRVDLYAVGDEVWFGELTPYPGSGLVPILPVSYDRELGAMWKLPEL